MTTWDSRSVKAKGLRVSWCDSAREVAVTTDTQSPCTRSDRDQHGSKDYKGAIVCGGVGALITVMQLIAINEMRERFCKWNCVLCIHLLLCACLLDCLSASLPFSIKSTQDCKSTFYDYIFTMSKHLTATYHHSTDIHRAEVASAWKYNVLSSSTRYLRFVDCDYRRASCLYSTIQTISRVGNTVLCYICSPTQTF